MKAALTISIGLNLALVGGVILLTTDRHKTPAPPQALSPVIAEPSAPAAITSSPPRAPEVVIRPFRWSDLELSNGYPGFIANLRASGCPEATLEDIVRGDTGRAFTWERNRLGLDGSGNGPWSESQEIRVIASLLGKSLANSTATVADTGQSAQENNSGGSGETALSQGGVSKTPLFLQDVNWSALGFDPGEEAAVARVRQQYQNAMNLKNPNSGGTDGQDSSGSSGQNSGGTTGQNSSGPADQNSISDGPNTGDTTSRQPSQSQTAMQDADNQLRNSLGSAGYAAYVQQQYMVWYQQQLAAAGSGPVTLNLPAAPH